MLYDICLIKEIIGALDHIKLSLEEALLGWV